MIKENISKLAVLNVVYGPSNQHQINVNVNVRLPPWLEIVKLATHGIPRGVHVDYRLSADAGSMWYTMQQDSCPQAILEKIGPIRPKFGNMFDCPCNSGSLPLFSLVIGWFFSTYLLQTLPYEPKKD